MSPIGCPICRRPLQLSRAGLCDLCTRLVCDRCLRSLAEARPDGLLPGTYCTTCLGRDHVDEDPQ